MKSASGPKLSSLILATSLVADCRGRLSRETLSRNLSPTPPNSSKLLGRTSLYQARFGSGATHNPSVEGSSPSRPIRKREVWDGPIWDGEQRQLRQTLRLSVHRASSGALP